MVWYLSYRSQDVCERSTEERTGTRNSSRTATSLPRGMGSVRSLIRITLSTAPALGRDTLPPTVVSTARLPRQGDPRATPPTLTTRVAPRSASQPNPYRDSNLRSLAEGPVVYGHPGTSHRAIIRGPGVPILAPGTPLSRMGGVRLHRRYAGLWPGPFSLDPARIRPRTSSVRETVVPTTPRPRRWHRPPFHGGRDYRHSGNG